jgi:ABC-type branched-subunit amino acid transport system substrate-binding protein
MRAARGLTCIFVSLLVVGACDGGDLGGPPREPVSSPAADDSLVIGLVGTTSGPDGWRGEDAFEGAHLAVAEVNRTRGADRPDYELVTRDDGGDPLVATELVQSLARSDRTVGVIYAGPQEGLPPAEAALAQAGIPAVLLAGDLYGIRQLSPHVFQASPPYAWQARRFARYLLRDRGYESIGAVVDDGAGGRAALVALRQELGRAGGRLAAVATYDRHEPDLDQSLDRLRAARVEALVVQGDPAVFVEATGALEERNAGYRGTPNARIASAGPRQRRARRRSNWWRPQPVGFDAAITGRFGADPPPGAIAADSYARGAGLLPVPSMQTFEEAFRAWWGEPTNGLEQRAYEAAHLIAWGAKQTEDDIGDRAQVLETMRGRRFGGLDVTLGPDDHTTVQESWVGLWTVPGSGDAASGTSELPWVPLARGFSTDGSRTDIPPEDWRYLFRDPPPRRPTDECASQSRRGRQILFIEQQALQRDGLVPM